MARLRVFLQILKSLFFLFTLTLFQVGCNTSVSSNLELLSTGVSSTTTTTLPPPFGTQGIARTKILTSGKQSQEEVHATALQSDGKLIVVGSTNARSVMDFAIFRYNTDGSLDSSFGSSGQVFTDIGTMTSDSPNAVTIQGDGKILVSGKSQNNFAIVRYNTDGSLDTTFGAGGKVTTDIGASSWDDVQGMGVQSDGKILVAGSTKAGIVSNGDFALVRYNTDGSLDTSFGSGGKVTTDIGANTDDEAKGMVIQSDGKILVAGTSGGSPDFAVVRYNTDGSLDASFGTGGKVTTDFGGGTGDYLHAIALQSDGKIILSGNTYVAPSEDFAVARYNTDGSLDATFGTGGKVTTDIGGNTNDDAYTMIIQSDGKILLLGGVAGGASTDYALVRYNTDGSLDASFGSGGKVTTDIRTLSIDFAVGMALQSDGKILTAGNSAAAGSGGNFDFAVVRYNTDGSLDTSFGSGGKVTADVGTGSTDEANAMALQSDGKILVAGSSNASGDLDFAVVRYNTNGSLDTSFGSGGKVTTDIGAHSDDRVYAMVVQSDGKILVAGKTQTGGASDYAVVRYNTDGSLDANFGSGGKVTTDIGASSTDGAYAMTLQSDGKILVAGYSNATGSYDFAVVRYNTDGSLDASFGSGGKVTTDISASSFDEAHGVAVQSDGKILVAGYFDYFAVVRYNADGSLDASFGTGGIVTTNLGTGSYDQVDTMTLQSDGKIVVAGASDASGSWDAALVRYNTDGSLDTSFGSGGKLIGNLGLGHDTEASAVAVQSDGKIVLGGILYYGGVNGNDFVIVRYNANGSLDTGFDSDGIVTTNLGTLSEANLHALSIQSNGQIFAAGTVNVKTVSESDFAIVRYNSDGSR
jgi:uncharacterized delta-60 repeat protein